MEIYKENMEKYKGIDFSSMHNVMLKTYDGDMRPMDEPYYEVRKLDEGTWQILSDGDFFYLLEGDEEGMCIDGGYGCGNVRKFCEDLIGKPVRWIANSHDHWDHVCNNSYFDCAFMSEACKEVVLGGNVMPSFGDIQFPRDYNIQVVKAGDIIPLKGRELEVFEFPDHAVSSLSYLDRAHRMFFVGDELSDWNKDLRNATVAECAKHMEVMWALEKEYEYCCSGTMVFHKSYVRAYLENCRYILSGAPTKVSKQLEPKRVAAQGQVYDDEGHIVYGRRVHRYPDGKKGELRKQQSINTKRFSEFSGCRIQYDPNKVL